VRDERKDLDRHLGEATRVGLLRTDARGLDVPRSAPAYEDNRDLAEFSQPLTETDEFSNAVGKALLSGLVSTMGLINLPALALDRDDLVLDYNAAAEQVFDEEVCLRHRRLFLADRRATSTLDAFVEQLRGTPDTATSPVAIIVVRRQTKQPLIIRFLRILPVDAAAPNSLLSARALLVLSDLCRRSCPQAGVLSQTFGLSPAEARLASFIATGVSPEHAAEILGIARQTARNQLKAVFAKTETHRQSELVALLSQL
jgi:DNA-binding CsgD family transcriptional regulator